MSNPLWIQKECLLALEVLRKIASEGECPVEDLIDVGSVLWEIRKKTDQLLEQIKPQLREEALKKADGKQKKVVVELLGHQRKCSVTLSPARFKISKQADIQFLREALGSQFVEYFRDTPTLVSDFEKRFSSASPEEKSTLLDSLVQQDSTPRISFKRGNK